MCPPLDVQAYGVIVHWPAPRAGSARRKDGIGQTEKSGLRDGASVPRAYERFERLSRWTIIPPTQKPPCRGDAGSSTMAGLASRLALGVACAALAATSTAVST